VGGKARWAWGAGGGGWIYLVVDNVGEAVVWAIGKVGSLTDSDLCSHLTGECLGEAAGSGPLRGRQMFLLSFCRWGSGVGNS
jgi:hypothetical protein